MRTREKKRLAGWLLLAGLLLLAGGWLYHYSRQSGSNTAPTHRAIAPEHADKVAKAKELRERLRRYEQGPNPVPSNHTNTTKKGTQ